MTFYMTPPLLPSGNIVNVFGDRIKQKEKILLPIGDNMCYIMDNRQRREGRDIKLELNVEALEKYMEAHEVTGRQLAEQMGVSYSTLYRVMRGQRNPGNEFVAKLLNTCELDFNQLFIYRKPTKENEKGVS